MARGIQRKRGRSAGCESIQLESFGDKVGLEFIQTRQLTRKPTYPYRTLVLQMSKSQGLMHRASR
ncbi:unnamed protein product [Dovyalis caffra]|uniref:Uncharacterized protein n=1 Tax=Dovyalis caffra TaxID=77055 RepID=A0AAV1SMQ7_9ROSI|nr:unnamed protein product [Dovyalis caffra]